MEWCRAFIFTLIEEEAVIRKILEHLELWEDTQWRPPPSVPEPADTQ
jgi:hypothetical protein